MNKMNKRNRVLLTGGAATLIAVAIAIVAVASGGAASTRDKRAADVDQTVAQVQSLLGDKRIVGAEVAGSTLHVTLAAPDSATATLARWDGKVLARAVSDQLRSDGQGTVTSATFSDQSGVDLNGATDAVGQAPDAAPLPAGSCEQAARANASASGVRVVVARTVPLVGGACVFVIQPSDVSDFVAHAPDRVGTIIGALPEVAAHPYVVEVVDSNNDPQLILGWIPAIGGGTGEGLGWVKPGVTSPAVLGTAAGTLGH